MGPEVIGAFVGALLAFVLGEVAARGRRRREAIEQATVALALELPEVLVAYSDRTPPGMDQSFDSRWWGRRSNVIGYLATIRAAARPPVWNHRAIRAAAEDVAARFTAAELRYNDGQKLTAKDLLEVTSRPLNSTVFRGARDVMPLVDWYVAHGYQSKPPASEKTPWWRRARTPGGRS